MLPSQAFYALRAALPNMADQFNIGHGTSSVARQSDSARLPMSLAQTQQSSTAFSNLAHLSAPAAAHTAIAAEPMTPISYLWPSTPTGGWYQLRPSSPIYIVDKIIYDHSMEAEVAAQTCSPNWLIHHTFPANVDIFRPAHQPATEIYVAIIRRATVRPDHRWLVATA